MFASPLYVPKSFIIESVAVFHLRSDELDPDADCDDVREEGRVGLYGRGIGFEMVSLLCSVTECMEGAGEVGIVC